MFETIIELYSKNRYLFLIIKKLKKIYIHICTTYCKRDKPRFLKDYSLFCFTFLIITRSYCVTLFYFIIFICNVDIILYSIYVCKFFYTNNLENIFDMLSQC